jgi:3-dehydroquinate dehydratase-2
MKKILIINGPNLNLLGKREPEIYGNKTFEEYLIELKKQFPETEINYFHSNIEGEIINKLQQADEIFDGIILNAGGYTHTSISISDTIAAISTPVIEVHISNILAREDFRSKSLIAPKCVGSISGFGLTSYRLAMNYFNK